MSIWILLPLLFALGGASRLALGQELNGKLNSPQAVPPSATAPTDAEHRLPADIQQAIRWLPEDTESIILARGPLKDGMLRDFRDTPPPSVVFPPPSRADGPATLGPPPIRFDAVQQPEPDFHQLMLAHSVRLFGLAGDAFIQNITKQKIRFVIAAARRFGPPFIGGESTYEGCEFILFDNAVPEAAVQATGQDKLGIEHIENNRVARIDTTWGGQNDEKLSIYYAKPKPNILIAATDLGFLQTILRRMAQPAVPHTPVLELPEWKYVDVQAPVWGIRHGHIFRNIPMKSGGPKIDPLGVVFFYRKRPAENVTLRWFHAPTTNSVTKLFGMDLHPLAPGVVGGHELLHRRPNTDVPGQHKTTDVHWIFWIWILMGYVVCP